MDARILKQNMNIAENKNKVVKNRISLRQENVRFKKLMFYNNMTNINISTPIHPDPDKGIDHEDSRNQVVELHPPDSGKSNITLTKSESIKITIYTKSKNSDTVVKPNMNNINDKSARNISFDMNNESRLIAKMHLDTNERTKNNSSKLLNPNADNSLSSIASVMNMERFSSKTFETPEKQMNGTNLRHHAGMIVFFLFLVLFSLTAPIGKRCIDFLKSKCPLDIN